MLFPEFLIKCFIKIASLRFMIMSYYLHCYKNYKLLRFNNIRHLSRVVKYDFDDASKSRGNHNFINVEEKKIINL